MPSNQKLIEQLPPDTTLLLEDEVADPRLAGFRSIAVAASGGDLEFGLAPAPRYFGDLAALRRDIESARRSYHLVVSAASLVDRVRAVLPPSVMVTRGLLYEGFTDARNGYVLLTEYEVFGRIPTRPRRSRYRGLFIDDLLGLKKGDYVVHEDFGIGQFEGLKVLTLENRQEECLAITYAGGDRVYLPIEGLNLVERYIASDERPPRLARLGRAIWVKTRARVKQATELLAVELLKLYAQRASSQGFSYSPDAEYVKTLELSFPYEETVDQQTAIEDVRRDMERDRPMDRLVCADVGFGKTEVAVRAALKAVVDRKQVAIVAPTTLLAFQHARTFAERLRNLPVRIEMLSRLRPRLEQRPVLAAIAAGKVDIAIGTHRLLQGDVQFKDLGLLVIDEEQRFGVMQKEKLRAKRAEVDTLSLSATPIPRTLYMALSGIRDISVIHSPPVGRKSIVTKVFEWNDDELRHAVLLERGRRGQVFFIHNRIETIGSIKERLHSILPEVSLTVLHGQMPTDRIEKEMVKFIDGEYDLLLSTAIVESGLDLPRVNTIIVNQADRLGLADLHQLRGRVGRSPVQAYAYFVVPEEKKMTPDARKRLGALLTYTSLGSGFRLAIRDMEIRGVGNLLGKEQHGFVNLVGYHLYLRLLSEAVETLKGRTVHREPVLELRIEAYIPEEYVADAFERIALYKRLMQAEDLYEISSLIEELRDRFGTLPKVMGNLFEIARIRLRAKRLGVQAISRHQEKFVVSYQDRKVEIEGLEGLRKMLDLEGR